MSTLRTKSALAAPLRSWAWVLALSSLARLWASDGSLDATFQSPAFNLAVPLIAVEANGKVIYAEAPDGIHYRIGRLTASGAAEASLDTGVGPESITPPIDVGTIHIPGATNPATINVIQPLANGQILVGGSFSHFNRVARKLLVRLNADGTVDTSFHQGTGFEGNDVYCLAIGPEGKIYAGGKFSKCSGSSRNVGLVRLNPDGSLDGSFVDSTISFGATITGLSLQPDGKVLGDAAYASATLQATRQVYRFNANGGLDSSFTQGAGTPAVAAGLRHGLMANGQVLLAGGNGTYNGAQVNSGLFRLNANGAWDGAYPGLTLVLVNTGGLIGRFLPLPDGRILFSGAFDQVSGHTLHGLARLNADGTLDPTFVPEIFVSPAPGALALQPDGKVLVCALASASPGVKYAIYRLNGAGGTAQPGPRLGPVAFLPNRVVQFPITGTPTQVVVLTSPDLFTWGNLSTNGVTNGVVSFTDPLRDAAKARFYRLMLNP